MTSVLNDLASNLKENTQQVADTSRQNYHVDKGYID